MLGLSLNHKPRCRSMPSCGRQQRCAQRGPAGTGFTSGSGKASSHNPVRLSRLGAADNQVETMAELREQEGGPQFEDGPVPK